jgi:hypothetical protein
MFIAAGGRPPRPQATDQSLGAPSGDRYRAPMNSGPHDEDEPTTQELKQEQAQREREEQRQLAESERTDEAKLHERRRDKAAYLRDKLAERERAEREAEED